MLDYPDYQSVLFGYLHQPVQGHHNSILVFRCLRSRRVEGLGDKGSGDGAAFVLQTLLEAFLNISLRSACFPDEAFF
jgi:hypothetical protein